MNVAYCCPAAVCAVTVTVNLCYASSACNRIGPVILKLFCSVSAATALFCSVIAGVCGVAVLFSLLFMMFVCYRDKLAEMDNAIDGNAEFQLLPSHDRKASFCSVVLLFCLWLFCLSNEKLIHPRNLLPGFFTVSDVRITTLRPHLHLSSPSY
ncbi:hypothetical protein RHGRI_004911 [Rhododendron griersonianum]|uniref:Uncharacterized protein n=1 Tax=Rhododendron griersonianum TaxID=479676 RepID=A0AAV6LAC6_9ERIC|nr:hypothetical protein RHGRI_004911 [Rhododendron griersonianum]